MANLERVITPGQEMVERAIGATEDAQIIKVFPEQPANYHADILERMAKYAVTGSGPILLDKRFYYIAPSRPSYSLLRQNQILVAIANGVNQDIEDNPTLAQSRSINPIDTNPNKRYARDANFVLNRTNKNGNMIYLGKVVVAENIGKLTLPNVDIEMSLHGEQHIHSVGQTRDLVQHTIVRVVGSSEDLEGPSSWRLPDVDYIGPPVEERPTLLSQWHTYEKVFYEEHLHLMPRDRVATEAEIV